MATPCHTADSVPKHEVLIIFAVSVWQALERRYSQLCQGFMSGDPEATAGMYTENCQLLHYGAAPISGRKGGCPFYSL